MEFIKTNEFRLNYVKEVKPTLTASRQHKRSERPKIVCCRFCLDIETLTCGLTDGTIIQFCPKKFNKKVFRPDSETHLEQRILGEKVQSSWWTAQGRGQVCPQRTHLQPVICD